MISSVIGFVRGALRVVMYANQNHVPRGNLRTLKQQVSVITTVWGNTATIVGGHHVQPAKCLPHYDRSTAYPPYYDRPQQHSANAVGYDRRVNGNAYEDPKVTWFPKEPAAPDSPYTGGYGNCDGYPSDPGKDLGQGQNACYKADNFSLEPCPGQSSAPTLYSYDTYESPPYAGYAKGDTCPTDGPPLTPQNCRTIPPVQYYEGEGGWGDGSYGGDGVGRGGQYEGFDKRRSCFHQNCQCVPEMTNEYNRFQSSQFPQNQRSRLRSTCPPPSNLAPSLAAPTRHLHNCASAHSYARPPRTPTPLRTGPSAGLVQAQVQAAAIAAAAATATATATATASVVAALREEHQQQQPEPSRPVACNTNYDGYLMARHPTDDEFGCRHRLDGNSYTGDYVDSTNKVGGGSLERSNIIHHPPPNDQNNYTPHQPSQFGKGNTCRDSNITYKARNQGYPTTPSYYPKQDPYTYQNIYKNHGDYSNVAGNTYGPKFDNSSTILHPPNNAYDPNETTCKNVPVKYTKPAVNFANYSSRENLWNDTMDHSFNGGGESGRINPNSTMNAREDLTNFHHDKAYDYPQACDNTEEMNSFNAYRQRPNGYETAGQNFTPYDYNSNLNHGTDGIRSGNGTNQKIRPSDKCPQIVEDDTGTVGTNGDDKKYTCAKIYTAYKPSVLNECGVEKIGHPPKFEELKLTLPARDGIILHPFRLKHNLVVSNHYFHLKSSLINMLAQRHDLDIQFKCFHHEDSTMRTNWPKNLSININSSPLEIDRGPSQTAHNPLYIKSFCNTNQNCIQITVSSCCCSHLFALQLVHRPTINMVIQGLMRKRLLPIDQCVRKIKHNFTAPLPTTSDPKNDGLEQTAIKVSLKCPITFKHIKIPGRGQLCRHAQCFDIESYLIMNSEREMWRCPICSHPAHFESLEIDQYMLKIVKQLLANEANEHAPNIQEITFDNMGSWKPMDGYATKIPKIHKSHAKAVKMEKNLHYRDDAESYSCKIGGQKMCQQSQYSESFKSVGSKDRTMGRAAKLCEYNITAKEVNVLQNSSYRRCETTPQEPNGGLYALDATNGGIMSTSPLFGSNPLAHIDKMVNNTRDFVNLSPSYIKSSKDPTLANSVPGPNLGNQSSGLPSDNLATQINQNHKSEFNVTGSKRLHDKTATKNYHVTSKLARNSHYTSYQHHTVPRVYHKSGRPPKNPKIIGANSDPRATTLMPPISQQCHYERKNKGSHFIEGTVPQLVNECRNNASNMVTRNHTYDGDKSQRPNINLPSYAISDSLNPETPNMGNTSMTNVMLNENVINKSSEPPTFNDGQNYDANDKSFTIYDFEDVPDITKKGDDCLRDANYINDPTLNTGSRYSNEPGDDIQTQLQGFIPQYSHNAERNTGVGRDDSSSLDEFFLDPLELLSYLEPFDNSSSERGKVPHFLGTKMDPNCGTATTRYEESRCKELSQASIPFHMSSPDLPTQTFQCFSDPPNPMDSINNATDPTFYTVQNGTDCTVMNGLTAGDDLLALFDS